MEILEAVAELPVKKVLREKGNFHPDVMTFIEVIKENEGDEWCRAEFKDPKEASVRALALRKAGYEANTRGAVVYARMPEADDE